MADAPKILQLKLSQIVADPDVQVRAEPREDVAEDYAELLQAGVELHGRNGREWPVVYQEGRTYWLADGFTRYRAHQLAGRKTILVQVLTGGRRDAILHSIRANQTHGAQLTRDDRRRAVMMVLTDDVWGRWSNVEVAKCCGVSEGTVRNVKEEVRLASQITSLSDNDTKPTKLPWTPEVARLRAARTLDLWLRRLEQYAGDASLAELRRRLAEARQLLEPPHAGNAV